MARGRGGYSAATPTAATLQEPNLTMSIPDTSPETGRYEAGRFETSSHLFETTTFLESGTPNASISATNTKATKVLD